MLYNYRSETKVHHNGNIFKDSKPKILLFGESCGVLLTSQAIDRSRSRLAGFGLNDPQSTCRGEEIQKYRSSGGECDQVPKTHNQAGFQLPQLSQQLSNPSLQSYALWEPSPLQERS